MLKKLLCRIFGHLPGRAFKDPSIKLCPRCKCIYFDPLAPNFSFKLRAEDIDPLDDERNMIALFKVRSSRVRS